MSKQKDKDMSGWNYRIVETHHGHGIYEVYYDRDGEIEGYSSFSLEGFTPEELKVEVEEIQKALSKPTLKESELKSNFFKSLHQLPRHEPRHENE